FSQTQSPVQHLKLQS
ncbi:rCG39749, partial [Rattus norvegicus]